LVFFQIFVILKGAIMKQEHTTPPGETPTNIPQSEVEKKKAHMVVEIIEYVPKSVVSKTIIKKKAVISACLLLIPVRN
jgi:hypothetical protein